MKKKEWSFEEDMKELAKLKKREEAGFKRLKVTKEEIEKVKDKLDENVWIFDKLIGKNVEFTYMGFDKLDRNCRRVTRGILTDLDLGDIYLDGKNDDPYDIDDIIKIRVIK